MSFVSGGVVLHYHNPSKEVVWWWWFFSGKEIRFSWWLTKKALALTLASVGNDGGGVGFETEIGIGGYEFFHGNRKLKIGCKNWWCGGDEPCTILLRLGSEEVPMALIFQQNMWGSMGCVVWIMVTHIRRCHWLESKTWSVWKYMVLIVKRVGIKDANILISCGRIQKT